RVKRLDHDAQATSDEEQASGTDQRAAGGEGEWTRTTARAEALELLVEVGGEQPVRAQNRDDRQRDDDDLVRALQPRQLAVNGAGRRRGGQPDEQDQEDGGDEQNEKEAAAPGALPCQSKLLTKARHGPKVAAPGPRRAD